MQQRRKSNAIPSQTPSPGKAAEPQKSAPVVIDAKSLRQIAGGVLQLPNGNW